MTKVNWDITLKPNGDGTFQIENMTSKKIHDIPSRYTSYAYDVIEGRIIAGKWIKLACQRFLTWLERDDIWFDWKAARRVERFIGLFHHWSGSFNGKPFTLLPYQAFLVYNLFGWKWVGTNKRVINKVYFSIGRKNGKTQLASAIAAYCFFASGEGDAQVYNIANSTQQAALSFNMAKAMLKQLDPKGTYFRFYRDHVKYDKTQSLLRVLSSDYGGLDGLNASCSIIDEYHAAQTSEVYSILRTSQASREQPIMMVITTAGFNLESPCKVMEDSCKDILQGNIVDDTQLALIYSLDEGDDYRDESTWVKANPSLGEIVRIDYLREQVKEAARNTTLETSVRTKNFNEWCSSSSVWLSQDTIRNSMKKLPKGFFKDRVVYCGIDLASVSDLTALAVLAYDEEEDKYYFRVKYYLPRDTVENSPNRELYSVWAKKGFLTVTEGNVTDYDYLEKDMLQIAANTDTIAQIGYDKWNSTSLIIKLEQEDGLPCIPVSQSIGMMNRPTKELTRLVLGGKVVFDHNPITRWCFANAALKTDVNENSKVVKGGSPSQKIDGVIACINALATLIEQPQFAQEVTGLQYS